MRALTDWKKLPELFSNFYRFRFIRKIRSIRTDEPSFRLSSFNTDFFL